MNIHSKIGLQRASRETSLRGLGFRKRMNTFLFLSFPDTLNNCRHNFPVCSKQFARKIEEQLRVHLGRFGNNSLS